MEKDLSFSPYELRMGIMYGVLLIGLFGVIDPYMLPEHFGLAWLLRYAFFTPLLGLMFVLSFFPYFTRIAKIPAFITLLLCQIIILVLIALASPSEPAYNHYYLGLLIVLLWTGFVSRFGLTENIILYAFTMVSLNLIFVFFNHSYRSENISTEIMRLLGSNILLVSSGAIILNGNLRMLKFKRKLKVEVAASILAKEKAEESSRLKTSFLANMSHEVRTPLNGMIGFADALQRSDITPFKRNLYLGFIQKGSHQLLNVINDIMDISKMESNQLKLIRNRYRVGKLLFEKVDYFKENILLYTKRPLSVELKIPPEYINSIIYTDENRFSQILDNLIINALKNTEQGSVEIGISGRANTPLHCIQIYVKDTGIGIEEKNFESIFETFHKIERRQLSSGNGIGLSITKKLVELMGGKIYVESEINVGSTFYFTMPVLKEQKVEALSDFRTSSVI